MALFPVSLPPPMAPGYELSPVEACVRTDMEVGAARSRVRTRARNDRVSVKWGFTDSQMGDFRAWFDNEITGAARGAAWFSVTLDIGNAAAAMVEARFIGIFKATKPAALHWDVTAQLEIR